MTVVVYANFYYKRSLEDFTNRGRRNAAALLYQRNNRGTYNAACAKRNARKLQATPSWADTRKIGEFYRVCAIYSKHSSVKHHVDHIYPLKSNWVCGLHVENNLQILTATENRSKGNRPPAGINGGGLSQS